MSSVDGFLDDLAARNPQFETILAEMRRQNPIPEPPRTQEDEEEVEEESRPLPGDAEQQPLVFFLLYYKFET